MNCNRLVAMKYVCSNYKSILRPTIVSRCAFVQHCTLLTVDVTNDVIMNYKESIDANPINVKFSSTIQCRKCELGCGSLVRSNW